MQVSGVMVELVALGALEDVEVLGTVEFAVELGSVHAALVHEHRGTQSTSDLKSLQVKHTPAREMVITENNMIAIVAKDIGFYEQIISRSSINNVYTAE
jgi:hypothetical protein